MTMKLRFGWTLVLLPLLLASCKPAGETGDAKEAEAGTVATVSGPAAPTHYLAEGGGRIVYAVSESGGEDDTAEVWMSKDGRQNWSRFSPQGQPGGAIDFKAEEEGVFEFITVGVDKIGNRERNLSPQTPPAFRVVVDRSAPRVNAAAAAEPGLAKAGAQHEYTWEAVDPYLASEPVELQVQFKKNPGWNTVARGLPARGRRRFTLPEAADDVAEVRFAATDRSGNVGVSSAGSLVFDRLPPQGRITGPSTAPNLETEISYEVSDPGAADLVAVTLWISANNGRNWRKLADAPPKSGSVKTTLPGPGNYGLAISATDSIGNQLAAPTRGSKPGFVVSTDVAPPKLEPLGWVEKGQVISALTPVTLKWKATDDNLAERPVTVEFSHDGGRHWILVAKDQPASGEISWAPPKGVNSAACLLRLSARDVLGNPSQVSSSRFITDNKPPATTATFEPID